MFYLNKLGFKMAVSKNIYEIMNARKTFFNEYSCGLLLWYIILFIDITM
jgi:hypothetical protein